jgi:hypothetical protein
VALYAERWRRRPGVRNADAVAQAWMDAEAYRLNTCGPPPGCSTGDGGARGQCQQDPLVRDRPGHPPGGAGPARPRAELHGNPAARHGAVARRLSLRPGRAHLRRHQRDPTQRGGRAPARAAARFQAVKHHLAGAQVALEFARPVVYAAAWSIDNHEPTASRAASTAKALASEAATEAARVALQVHGAIGYTWECDLHLFLKRTWALAQAWGSAADHRLAVLDWLTNPA